MVEGLKKSRHGLIIIFMVCLMSSCGFRFVGEGKFPADVQRIFIAIFENRSNETGVESLFTNDLVDEFTRNRKNALAAKPAADAQLHGVIESITQETISRSGQLSALERRVRAAVALRLTDSNGRLLWKREVSEEEEYAVGSSNSATERNRKDAIEELSKRLAERIYDRLTDDF